MTPIKTAKTNVTPKIKSNRKGDFTVTNFNTDYRGKDNTNGSQIASRIEADRKREEKLWKKKQR